MRFDPTEAPRDRAALRRPARRHARLGQDARRAERSPTPPSGAAALVVDFDPKPDHGLDRRARAARARSRCWSSRATPSTAASSTRCAIGLPELREELASSYLIELLRDPPPAWENAIDRAVRDAVRAGERSLMPRRRPAALSDVDAAREAGEALEVLSDFGLARLGFAADGEGESASDAAQRR